VTDDRVAQLAHLTACGAVLALGKELVARGAVPDATWIERAAGTHARQLVMDLREPLEVGQGQVLLRALIGGFLIVLQQSGQHMAAAASAERQVTSGGWLAPN
jgi:hypothetical protein